MRSIVFVLAASIGSVPLSRRAGKNTPPKLIGTDGRLTRGGDQGDVRERRRIEIRMRKSK